MRFLVISMVTGKQVTLSECRTRLIFLARNQRVFLVITIQSVVSVKRLAKDVSLLEAQRHYEMHRNDKSTVPISKCQPETDVSPLHTSIQGKGRSCLGQSKY